MFIVCLPLPFGRVTSLALDLTPGVTGLRIPPSRLYTSTKPYCTPIQKLGLGLGLGLTLTLIMRVTVLDEDLSFAPQCYIP